MATASRHGATTRIGDVIAGVLADAGHVVTRLEVFEDDDVAAVLQTADIDAAVIGGSVYTGSWLARATIAQALLIERGVRTYAFAVGVLDVTPDVLDPAVTAPRTTATASARVTFAGIIDRSALSMRERSLLAVVRAKEGEFTDWDGVRAWAGAVAADPALASAPSAGLGSA